MLRQYGQKAQAQFSQAARSAVLEQPVHCIIVSFWSSDSSRTAEASRRLRSLRLPFPVRSFLIESKFQSERGGSEGEPVKVEPAMLIGVVFCRWSKESAGRGARAGSSSSACSGLLGGRLLNIERLEMSLAKLLSKVVASKARGAA